MHKRANLRIILQKSKPKATFSANLRFSEASAGLFAFRERPVPRRAGGLQAALGYDTCRQQPFRRPTCHRAHGAPTGPPPRTASPSGRTHAHNGSRSLASFLVLQMPNPSRRPRRREVIASCATLSPTLRSSYTGTTPVSTPRSPKRSAASPPSRDDRARGPPHGLKHP